MADRAVTKTCKDAYGDILALCSDNGDFWSPRQKHEVINDIECNLHTYYVLWIDVGRTEIRVVAGPTGKYLRTDRDSTSRNNLSDLPDC